MDEPAPDKPRPVLDPMERLSEILFGLIMAMTFSTAFGFIEGGQADVTVMLAAMIGCNLAWGFIDAVMYLMNTLAERGQSGRILRDIKTSANPARAGRVLAAAMPAEVARAFPIEVLNDAAQALRRLPGPPPVPRIALSDFKGAIGVFLLVVLATAPVVVPFVLIDDPRLAVRVSNIIGIALLFIVGRAFGQIAGYPPYRMAAVMVLIGTAMVLLAILLGG